MPPPPPPAPLRVMASANDATQPQDGMLPLPLTPLLESSFPPSITPSSTYYTGFLPSAVPQQSLGSLILSSTGHTVDQRMAAANQMIQVSDAWFDT